MNISSLTSNPIKLPLPVQARAEQAVKAIAPEVEPELGAKEKFAKAFYSKEDEPWNDDAYYIEEYGENVGPLRHRMSKEEYITHQYATANTELKILYSRYDKFMANLNQINPELAQKNFSFTLGDDAEIIILDPKNNLSLEQVEWLSDAMNDFKDLKEVMQTHAKRTMAIVDHDTETFGGRINLNLLNLHKVIDYGTIINTPTDDYNEKWLTQIKEKGEKHEKPLIDVRA